ncbi:MAG: YfhO family protein [Clostridia bacterium]|nr:YfhO family protein [Clostridia bacterium]
MEPTVVLKPKKELHWQTFLTALGVAALIFLPFVIKDRGYFLFYGDFNVQQIPFYQMCHAAVRNGDIFWNWGTDLGVNFIGSYSFYLLGSPFFWFTLLFPNAAVPYLMAPLLVLKFALAAFTAYFYIRRFTHKPQTAMLAALLYAFSGFSVYNVFFNHFHEAIIFFPLLLLGLEMLITENRKGVFALCVFICALSNYFFFFGMVVFTVIYWIVRTCGRCYKQSVGRFFLMLFEALLGVAMAAVILLPSFYAVIQNSRVGSISYGWNAWVYGKEQIYLNILQCFFFPPDIPARPVFFPGAEVKWASLGGWLPLFGMTGVIAFMQAKKGHWARRIICISAFMALVPILNSAFYMFNSAYYARWFYMPILIMCVATALAIDDRSIEWDSAFRWTFIITFAAAAIIGIFPSEVTDGKVTKWGLFTEPENQTYLLRFWITCAIALLCLIILKSLLGFLRERKRQFLTSALCLVCMVSVVYSVYFIACGKQHSHTNSVMLDQLVEGELDLGQDEETFRIDVYDGVDNTGMYLGLYSINTFHSIVPGSVIEFYEYVGEERNVASRPSTDTVAIRSLLSVKYLLNNTLTGEAFEDENGETEMPGFSYYKTDNQFKIYSNENYIPLGFVYDYYMTKEQCERFGESYRDDMMLKALLLDQEQIEAYKNILTCVDESDAFNNIYNEGDEADYYSIDEYFSADTVREDCAELRQNASYNFVHSSRGFSCTMDLKNKNLVFFSVPYEEGWTAYVNGKPAKIEKVNVGFMAVLADAGVNEIEFVYTTPGLKIGVCISIAAFVLFLLYATIGYFYGKKHPRHPDYPEGEALQALWAAYDAADTEAQELEDLQEDLYFGTKQSEQDDESEEFSLKYRTHLGGFTIDDSFLKDLNKPEKNDEPEEE